MSHDQLRRDIDAALQRGDMAEACNLLDLVIAANPADREARYAAARLCRAMGDRDGAISRYQACLEFDPKDEVAHFGLSVLGVAPPPERVPDGILHYVFDRNADIYEASMSEIGYRTPEVLAGMLAKQPLPPESTALDIGCGTGLNAPFLRPRVRRLVGIDLSEPMLDLARAKRLYDELACAEMGAWLSATSERFDLITATNVFMYFGSLIPVFKNIRAAMTLGGLLAFDLELLPDDASDDFRLGIGQSAGRYAHRASHANEALATAGLELITSSRGTMRTELAKPVEALFIIAAAPRTAT